MQPGCGGAVVPGHRDAGGLAYAILMASDLTRSGSNGIPDASRQAELRARLDGSTILLVEDEAMVAMDIEFALKDAGAQVLGPAASLQQALEIAQSCMQIDAAILDVDLGGADVLPLAELLKSRSVPFVFHTGVGREAQMAGRFPDAPLHIKPIAPDVLLDDLASLMT